MDDAKRMASRFYGHGRWDAPYWFIGPEQGQAKKENDDLGPRIRAWLQLGAEHLNDCGAFHELLAERRWHQERPSLQPTWRPLLLLLMKFLGKPTDKDSLRYYQRDRWGRLREGETCVIELSGLPANNVKVSGERTRKLFGKEEINVIRNERIAFIRDQMRSERPTLVVMYGWGERKHWEEIAGRPFPSDDVLKLGQTMVALTRHPTAHGSRNQYWEELGQRLRRESSR